MEFDSFSTFRIVQSSTANRFNSKNSALKMNILSFNVSLDILLQSDRGPPTIRSRLDLC